jgi:hypothetical protein
LTVIVTMTVTVTVMVTEVVILMKKILLIEVVIEKVTVIAELRIAHICPFMPGCLSVCLSDGQYAVTHTCACVRLSVCVSYHSRVS